MPSDAGRQRLKRIIEAAGVRLPEAAEDRLLEKLSELATHVCEAELGHFSEAWMTRRQPKGGGRRRDRVLDLLMAGLVDVWMEAKEALPGVSFTPSNRTNVKAGTYHGAFVGFAVQFCRELAKDLVRVELANNAGTVRNPAPGRTLGSLRSRLSAMNGSKVHSRLRGLGFPQMRGKQSKRSPQRKK